MYLDDLDTKGEILEYVRIRQGIRTDYKHFRSEYLLILNNLCFAGLVHGFFRLLLRNKFNPLRLRLNKIL